MITHDISIITGDTSAASTRSPNGAGGNIERCRCR
jgi:hypothetical protein